MQFEPSFCTQYVVEKAQKFSDTHITKTSKFVNKTDLKLKKNDVNEPLMFGILYKIIHRSYRNYSDTNYTHKPVIKKHKSYDRIFLFGELEGGTFAVVNYDYDQSWAMMTYAINEIAIGTPFILVNPKLSKGLTLLIDMPTIKSELPLIPLKLQVYDILPIVKPSDPEAEETTFFLLKEAQVQFIRPRLIGKGDVIPPSCNGCFCDRKSRRYGYDEDCGCFNRMIDGSLHGIVLESDIIVHHHDCTFQTEDVRSWRTTNLFVRNINKISHNSRAKRDQYWKPFAKSVECCAKQINNNRGFTVVGTKTRKLVEDCSDNYSLISSSKPSQNISFLHPTDNTVLLDDKYRFFQLDPTIKRGEIIDLEDDTNKSAPNTRVKEKQHKYHAEV